MTNLVSFPGLGLEFALNRVAFEVLGRPIYWYGVIIASGLLLAVFLCIRWSGRFGLNEDQIVDMMLFAVPAALVAVRVYYVIFNLDMYKRVDGALDWAAILRYSDGGLAIYGAIISSAIVLFIFCRVRKLSFAAFADLGVHGLLIGQLIGRWGNFMNVEAYGTTTALPWRMCAPSIAGEMLKKGYVDQAGYEAILTGNLGVHPTFLYESLWNLVGLFLVYHMGKKRKFDGQCCLFYFLWYGVGRAWIEGLRTDSLYFFGLELFGMPIRTSQMLALVSALAAGALLLWMLSRKTNSPEKLYVNRLAAQRGEQTGTVETGGEPAPEEGTEEPAAGDAQQKE